MDHAGALPALLPNASAQHRHRRRRRMPAAPWSRAIRFRQCRRGIFSMRQVLGSAPFCPCLSQYLRSAQRGVIAMLSTFIDTIIVCSIRMQPSRLLGAWTSWNEERPPFRLAFSSTFKGTLATMSLLSPTGWRSLPLHCWAGACPRERCAQFPVRRPERILRFPHLSGCWRYHWAPLSGLRTLGLGLG
ncbi:alanine:cation symporter family protein [Alcanivorax sp.]|uniref:alanine:cation symporter family protein n=1 Tax=Alcanivorax sp. TaxID=1872427 RepID=UPI00342B29C5